MSDITWGEPPARTGAGRTANPEEVATASALIANTEQWGQVKVDGDMKKLSTVAQSIRSGKRAGYVQALVGLEGRFDACVRKIEGEAEQWGLWVKHTLTPAPKRKPRGSAAKKAKATEAAPEPAPAPEPPAPPADSESAKADTSAAFSNA